MNLTTPAIEVAALRKTYGDQVVLDGLDLTVPAGTVYALLGPNGAGKTTTVNICSTLLAPDAGTVAVAGHDVRTQADAVRRSIGLTGQFSAIDELLTGRENLRLMADLAHLPKPDARARVDEQLARFGLTDAADRRAATYSGGMKRRLDLAMTLVSRPQVIFLDEPTTGLDPRSRRDLWQIVRELVADGVTILLTTQYLEEADQLAHTVGLLDGGRLVAEGTPAQLKEQAGGETLDDVFLALTGHPARTDQADDENENEKEAVR
ncbi:ABC transporter ATP-binding protein [Pimelobacter simplex]|uniref:ABC transporter ATP-binding protein n=1 Tax=Nocardioides simplex TaxID=2045 RepID=UPI003AACDCF5